MSITKQYIVTEWTTGKSKNTCITLVNHIVKVENLF